MFKRHKFIQSKNDKPLGSKLGEELLKESFYQKESNLSDNSIYPLASPNIYNGGLIFDRSTIKSFESILDKVPKDIVTIFNEIIQSGSELKDPVIKALKRHKEKAQRKLDRLELFSKRPMPSIDTRVAADKLNKLALSDKFTGVYSTNDDANLINPKLSTNEANENILYLPLYASEDINLIMSLLIPPEVKRQTIICSDWFLGPLFVNIYNYASGAYPIIDHEFYDTYQNLLKLSNMEISSKGCSLGEASKKDCLKYNQGTIGEFFSHIKESKGNRQIIYPESSYNYPYLDLKFKETSICNSRAEIKIPPSFAKMIIRAIEEDPSLKIKPLVISIDKKSPEDSSSNNLSFERQYLLSKEKHLATHVYVHTSTLDTSKLEGKSKIEKSRIINEDLYKEYKDALEHIDEMQKNHGDLENILLDEQRLIHSKIKHMPDFSVTNMIKDLCDRKTPKGIKETESYALLKGLDINMDALIDPYPNKF